jgi:hypothetical protein
MAGDRKKWMKLLALGVPAAGAAALSFVVPQAWMQQLLILFILLWFNVGLIINLT